MAPGFGRALLLPCPERDTAFEGFRFFWEGSWEGLAANRCKGMPKNENGRASNRVSLQQFEKESNEKQKLAKNLKTAAGNRIGVRIPGPPLDLRDCLRRGWEGF
jgi:hypothetical protein